jgi:hypothetical protein
MEGGRLRPDRFQTWVLSNRQKYRKPSPNLSVLASKRCLLIRHLPNNVTLREVYLQACKSWRLNVKLQAVAGLTFEISLSLPLSSSFFAPKSLNPVPYARWRAWRRSRVSILTELLSIRIWCVLSICHFSLSVDSHGILECYHTHSLHVKSSFFVLPLAIL